MVLLTNLAFVQKVSISKLNLYKQCKLLRVIVGRKQFQGLRYNVTNSAIQHPYRDTAHLELLRSSKIRYLDWAVKASKPTKLRREKKNKKKKQEPKSFNGPRSRDCINTSAKGWLRCRLYTLAALDIIAIRYLEEFVFHDFTVGK